jgi:hypothetical protein
MIAALLVLAPYSVCGRCQTPKPITWEDALKRGAQRAKEANVADLRKIVYREGGGTPSRHARNPRSTAYGLGQFLNSTWKSTGIKKTDCGTCQIEAMVKYCRGRYGSVAKAWGAWQKKRWY